VKKGVSLVQKKELTGKKPAVAFGRKRQGKSDWGERGVFRQQNHTT